MKRKIMAIWVILLLIGIPTCITQASETQANEQSNETVSIEMVYINEAGTLTTETLSISEEELAEFENTISIIMDKIQSATSWEELQNIINNLPIKNGIITSLILKILSKFKLLISRGLIISLGHSFKLNPFKRNSFKLRQRLIFWYYTGKTSDRTIILQPLAFKMKILKGLQFGYMSKFFGIYIFIAKKLPQKSLTFFIGTVRRTNGIQLIPS